MANKNTIIVKCSTKEYTLHFIPRVTTIEVQVYPFGDPKRAETIGYYSKTYKTFDAVGPRSAYEYPKYMATAILNHEYDENYKSLFYRMLRITPVGKQTILRRVFEQCKNKK